MSPTQASKSSTSLLFSSSTSNYHRQRILADQLQRAMDSLNQQTAVEDISEEEEDENDNRDDLDGGLPPRESRHRLHIVEDDAATTLSMLDTYSSQLLQGRMPDNDSDSSDDSLHHDIGGNHARSVQVEGEDDESDASSSRPYPGGGGGGSGSYVSMFRRSRLLGGRVGEESPIDSDEELGTTADQSKCVLQAFNLKACKKAN